MPVYKVNMKYTEEFNLIVRANSEAEAVDLSHKLCEGIAASDYVWYSGNAEKTEETEAIND